MTSDLFVENLCQRVKAGEIRCEENLDGSYILTTDAEEFELKMGSAFSRGGPIFFLTYIENDEEKIIVEPQIHLSQAPIGRGLRSICKFLKLEEFPKYPENPQARENERLRIAMVRLGRLAARQCNPHADQPVYNDAPFDRLLRGIAGFLKKS